MSEPFDPAKPGARHISGFKPEEDGAGSPRASGAGRRVSGIKEPGARHISGFKPEEDGAGSPRASGAGRRVSGIKEPGARHISGFKPEEDGAGSPRASGAGRRVSGIKEPGARHISGFKPEEDGVGPPRASGAGRRVSGIKEPGARHISGFKPEEDGAGPPRASGAGRRVSGIKEPGARHISGFKPEEDGVGPPRASGAGRRVSGIKEPGARHISGFKPEARFGPAGTADSFAAMGYRKMSQIPEYLQKFGLTAFEYQCGHGLKVNHDTLRAIGAGCAAAGIAVSLHAPYYISLSSVEPQKRDNSVGYILESARLVRELGGTRVVVHSGSAGKLPRERALALARDTLGRAQKELDAQGLSEIRLCPETMGKVNQLGDLQETLALCAVDERFLPTVDFGHLNARSFGGIRGKEDFARILDAIRDALGAERARSFHAHFSKIAYTTPGGEKAHLTFRDTEFGPAFEPLLELLAARSLSPTIICESAGTQSEDAKAMRDYYRALAPRPKGM